MLTTAVAVNLYPDLSGSISGLFQSAMILGGLLAQPVTGLVIDLFGNHQGVLVPTFSAFLALIILILLQRELAVIRKLPRINFGEIQ